MNEVAYEVAYEAGRRAGRRNEAPAGAEFDCAIGAAMAAGFVTCSHESNVYVDGYLAGIAEIRAEHELAEA